MNFSKIDYCTFMECYMVKTRKHTTHKSTFSPNQLGFKKIELQKRKKKEKDVCTLLLVEGNRHS